MCRKQIKNDLPQLKEILEQIIDEFEFAIPSTNLQSSVLFYTRVTGAFLMRI